MGIPKHIPNYSIDDYMLWGGDWELWDGVAISMSPSPFGPHGIVAAELIRQLSNQLIEQSCDECRVLSEIDWVISRNTVVRPDVSIVCGEVPTKHVSHPPDLVCEITSATTAHRDWGLKRVLYAGEGVAHYLIVDPEARRIEWLSLNLDGNYVNTDPSQPHQLHDSCELRIDMEQLFRKLS